MVARKQITFIYSYDDNWIGGTYYILNIIRALKFLDDIDQPHVTIVHHHGSNIDAVKAIEYKFISIIEISLQLSIASRFFNKFASLIFGRRYFKLDVPGESVYPVNFNINTDNKYHYYFWIPDFQDRYLPQFFSEIELRKRLAFQNEVFKTSKPIVFSSQNALDDFNKFYPKNTNLKKVLSFVSIIAGQLPSEDKMAEKYKLSFPYFIVSNQFWKHKNHEVVLKAAKILKEREVTFHVVFTGKEHDLRNPEHTNTLKEFVKNNNLEHQVSFLGFIERNDQLALMKFAMSVIQPSLFEGWSTVVEDSKALNQFILLSDIPLHREQIAENCEFFDPHNPIELAAKMEAVLLHGVSKKIIDYKKEQISFAKNIICLFS